MSIGERPDLSTRLISMFPTLATPIPYLTTEQMIEVDRAMIEDFHISLIQMMENAGRNLAHLARIRFSIRRSSREKDTHSGWEWWERRRRALVCARRLHNWGANVHVYLSKSSDDFAGVVGDQLAILKHMNVPTDQFHKANNDFVPDLIIDGLIGYSLRGTPRGTTAAMINWANHQDAPVLALDTPSGLDVTTGEVFEPTIQATATMTLALPKMGLVKANARSYVGELSG